MANLNNIWFILVQSKSNILQKLVSGKIAPPAQPGLRQLDLASSPSIA